MQSNNQKIWFPAKKYGWGWGSPCAWQGWVVMVAWFAMVFAGGFIIAPHSIGFYFAYLFSLSGLLIAVAFAKGEKPRWRWGGNGKPQAKSVAERLAELEESRSLKLISDAEYEAKRREVLKDL